MTNQKDSEFRMLEWFLFTMAWALKSPEERAWDLLGVAVMSSMLSAFSQAFSEEEQVKRICGEDLLPGDLEYYRRVKQEKERHDFLQKGREIASKARRHQQLIDDFVWQRERAVGR